MEKLLIGKPMRAFFLFAGVLMWLGIWLTGFGAVHWVLYLPTVFFTFAAVTSICPGMIFMNKLFGAKPE